MLTPGTRLGSYEIVDLLGTGGMGEVYRARDVRLGRDVAVKTCSGRFSDRFARESRVIASLNHPNICTLHDVGPDFLVMELVEGSLLSDRITEGPTPIEQALAIARQIADALEAAHEKGIVHRDLKPGNIMIKPDGTVKVLDFGLAKALSPDLKVGPTGVDANSSTVVGPTFRSGVVTPGTQMGTILGTVPYMAPEQAQGKPADKRADIWAFGVVLHEMLTGRRLFKGESAADTIAAVLTREPEWDRIPAQVRPLLRRCLERDPKRRLRDIGDAMALLDSAPESVRTRPSYLAWSVTVVSLVALSVVSLIHFQPKASAPAESTRFYISPPDAINFTRSGAFAVSPNGRRLVFFGQGRDGVNRLWLRDLGSLESRLLPGTESSATVAYPPFWSFDSQFVAYDAGGTLRKIDVSGGSPRTICDLPTPAWGGSWNPDGVVIIGNTSGGLWRVPATGGVVSTLTALDSSRQETAHEYPHFLPDGKRFVYLRVSRDAGQSGIYVGSLDVRPEEQSTRRVVGTGFGAGYTPTPDRRTGRLLFLQGSKLFAQTFDTRRLEVTGSPITISEQVGSTFGDYALFSASATGVLIYRTLGRDSQLTWYDRKGHVVGTVGDVARYGSLALSPDGTRAIVSRTDPRSANEDVWMIDLSRSEDTRFTFDPGPDVLPTWSPDGGRIAFVSRRANTVGLYQKPASGPGGEELLATLGTSPVLSDWSRDGRYLIYHADIEPRSGSDLWLLPLSDRKPVPFARRTFWERWGRVSPDMRWLAYLSNESTRMEIYVQPFSPTPDAGTSAAAGTWMVSSGGGTLPRWRRDTTELYYIAADLKVMAVDISTGPAFHHGAPKVLFTVPAAFLQSGNQGISTLMDVTADGQRFLFAMPVNTREELTVVLNWTAELKR